LATEEYRAGQTHLTPIERDFTQIQPLHDTVSEIVFPLDKLFEPVDFVNFSHREISA
jgi:hypothetical protein